MTIGKCYHLNGEEMAEDFKVDFLPELIELLCLVINNDKDKS